MALPNRVIRALSDPFEAMHREVDNVLGRMLGMQQDGSCLAPYAVDVREDGDHLYVQAELPGFKKEEIDITLENQTLTISAERKEEPPKQGEFLLKERRFTRFLRSFTLPPTVDEQTVDAKLVDGILTVVLNRREESKPRKIQVS